jgi:hypothetical protein
LVARLEGHIPDPAHHVDRDTRRFHRFCEGPERQKVRFVLLKGPREFLNQRQLAIPRTRLASPNDLPLRPANPGVDSTFAVLLNWSSVSERDAAMNRQESLALKAHVIFNLADRRVENVIDYRRLSTLNS